MQAKEQIDKVPPYENGCKDFGIGAQILHD